MCVGGGAGWMLRAACSSDMRVSFRCHKDEVVQRKANMYRFYHNEKCEWDIIFY